MMSEHSIVRIIGVGVALTCILWILGHLIAFSMFGYILVGETNKLILLMEILFIASGLTCFLIDFIKREKGDP